MLTQMEVVPQLDGERTVHFVRNIVGRVTYGLVGLDKLMQGKTDDANEYLRSFLSLFQPSSGLSGTSHRLLPQVEGTLGLYSPRLTKGLQGVAAEIQEIRSRRNTSPEKIREVYSELAGVLDMIYEATGTRSRRGLY